MTATPARESRRYDFPPLWAVPLLLIAVITIGMWIAVAYGWPWFILALAAMWWLETKADAYVRTRDARLD